MPFSPEYALDELEGDPQIAHLDMVYTVESDIYGPVRSLHRPVRVDGSRAIAFRAPPDLGEHTAEILDSLQTRL